MADRTTAQKSFQDEMDKFKKHQKRYQKLITISGQLDTHMNENMMVQEELSLARPDSKVYKLTGKVLIPHSLSDAKSNVERRMKFIEEEQKRNNEEIEQVRKGITEHREKMTQIDKQLQSSMVRPQDKKLEGKQGPAKK